VTDRVRATVNTGSVAAQVRAAAVDGLTKAAEHLLQVSRGQVPLETGTLERSGVATVDEANLQAAVSYDTPYAVRQHEDLTLDHDRGRKAKYLEDPANQEAATMAKIIQAALQDAIGE
jgi:hypothetical protein